MSEWRVEAGRLLYQRRFGNGVTGLGEATRLDLTERTDQGP
jgi:hypothetical protein